MPIKQIDVREANLEELITLVQQGIEILLIEDGIPVAWMLPPSQTEKPRISDLFPGIWTSDDFDDPL